MTPEGPLDETTIIPPARPPALPARYEPLGELGRGGMGIVYKARDRETNEVLAIKVLKSDIATDIQVLDRFKNELRLARQITHRNVARLYEFHRAGESVYLSMEYVEGESLRALLQRVGKLPVEQALSFARQLADGLSEAHWQSIAHRDLKPENIMIAPGGQLKVMDFGISRSFAADVTATGAIIGTPAYMAPEQAEGRPVDHRTDIYAYGLVLYEMFTGAAAFTGDTAISLAMKQIRERPKAPRTLDPTLPKHIEAAILRCLEKDPAARFQSIEDAIRALEGSPGAPVLRPRRRLPLKALAAGAVLLIVVFAVWRWRSRPSDSILLPMESFTLANGLHVTLSPDHSSPTFTVAVAYRAGTRYEEPDHIGLAHLTEHLMFQGSENVGRGEHMALVADAGGNANGQTGSDLSIYWENLPANQLELALYLEADRMRGLSFTPEGLSAARAALSEERNVAVSNPFARIRLAITSLSHDRFPNQGTIFPPVEHWNAATVDDVARYYRTHYSPSTAGLVICGDIDRTKARDLVRKYFEPIAKRDQAPDPDLREPDRTAEKREVRTEAGIQTPVLLISWRIPSVANPDWFAVKRFGEVLGVNDASRLQTALVKNAGLASAVLVNLEDSNGPNLLTAQVVMAQGKDPAVAERMIYDEIDRVGREGVPRGELDAVATDAIRRRAFQLITTVVRANAIARFLTSYGELDAINRWEQEESRVSSDVVRQAAQKYFAPSNRTVLLVNPGDRP